MWRSLCEVVGRLDLRDDEGLATRQGRYTRRFEIWEALEAGFKTRNADTWVEMLRKAEVPVGVVNPLDRSLSDPQVLHRDMVLDIAGPDGLSVKVAGNPLKMSGNDHSEHRFPPRLGQDTRDVLVERLGIGDAEIEGLVKAGIVNNGQVKS